MRDCPTQEREIENMTKRYQIRTVAGIHWLLDMQQPGYPEYVRPIPLNQSAKEIWDKIEKGDSRQKIAEDLCKEKGISKEMALRDLDDWIMQLKARGVIIE